MSESIEQILELSDELEEQERHIKEANVEIERLNNIINKAIEYVEQGIWSNGIDEDRMLFNWYRRYFR